jgi:hypothetical protein
MCNLEGAYKKFQSKLILYSNEGAVGLSETLVYMTSHPRDLIIEAQDSGNLKLHKIVEVVFEKNAFS